MAFVSVEFITSPAKRRDGSGELLPGHFTTKRVIVCNCLWRSALNQNEVAWKTFLRIRRFRYYCDPTFAEEIEAFKTSVEVPLFGVERKGWDGRIRDPEGYIPAHVTPPINLNRQEEDLLRKASIQVLWE